MSGRPRKGIDLLVDPSGEIVRAIKRALSSLPDNAAKEVADQDVRFLPLRMEEGGA